MYPYKISILGNTKSTVHKNTSANTSTWLQNIGSIIIKDTLKTESCHDANFMSSLVVLQVVIMTTCSATIDDKVVVMTTYNAISDDKVGIMMTLSFQYMDNKFWWPSDQYVIVRRAGLLWSQQDFEWRWSVPLFKCLTVLEFSFILFDLCLLITFFNFIMNYVPIVTFWIFTYNKIWILSIMFCSIWSYWIIYFLACL